MIYLQNVWWGWEKKYLEQKKEVLFVTFKNAFTFSCWCHNVLTVTISWCYIITRERCFRVYFIQAEDFSLLTKSNLMHIVPWSEDGLRQLSSLSLSEFNFNDTGSLERLSLYTMSCKTVEKHTIWFQHLLMNQFKGISKLSYNGRRDLWCKGKWT